MFVYFQDESDSAGAEGHNEDSNRLEASMDTQDNGEKREKGKTDDLFSAHDFDIKIDIEVPLQSMCITYNHV